MRNIILWVLFFSVSIFANESKLPADSIYNIKSKWSNQNGEALNLERLKGENVIITMVYTGCAHACPMTISKVQEIENGLIQAGIKDYKLVLASFDSEKDSPEVLKKYMKTRGLSEDHWVFLSAPNDGTARELAVSLGISYKAISGGGFSHSNVISFMNRDGVVKSKIESLTADIVPLIENVKESVQKKDGV